MATNKAELNLLMAVRKAISMEETSPKQKHVRTCIMNTWDNKSSRVFWAALKNLPFLSNEIQCFKALITIHKVIRQGHPATLTEAINEKKWIENLPRMLITDQFEYAGLIKEYVQFISYKLDFHRLHSDFNSTFDYEEYTSMKELSDVNEGYETIFELMELLDRVDQLQIFIFSSMRNAVTNECRLAAVVPLIEESYAIYRFVTSMLRAIHVRVGSMDALESLREKYINQHHMLRKFYDHSRRFVYITSLVTIPELPSTPPSFYDAEALPKMNSSFPLTSDKDEAEDFVLLNKGSDAMIPIAQNTLVAAQPQPQVQLQHEQYQWLIQQHQSQLQEHSHQQVQLQTLLKDREEKLSQLHEQLFRAKALYDQSQLALKQYEQKIEELTKSQNRSSLEYVESSVSPFKKEVDEWKSKYEALAKLYAQLRKEHLELIKNHQLVESELKSLKSQQDQLNKLQTQLNAKNLQLADLMREKEELMHKDRFSTIENSKFQNLQSQIQSLQNEYDHYKKDKDEEILILQTSVDQSLEAMAKLRFQLDQDRGTQVANLEKNYVAQLDKLLDATLMACIKKIQVAKHEFQNSLHQGHVHATPASALTIIESTLQAAGNFSQLVLAFINGSEGADQAETIISVNHLTYTFLELLNELSGLSRFVPETSTKEEGGESQLDLFFKKGQQSVIALIEYLFILNTKELAKIPGPQRTSKITEKYQCMLMEINHLTQFIDQLNINRTSTKLNLSADMETVVEKEMQSVQVTVREASEKLQALLATPLNPFQITVHSAILSAAMALMQTLGNLIRCAISSQQEIVEHGRGTGSAMAYYKKNHRWTEGLVSAAQEVALATCLLVETADGMVQNTHSIEQMMVAANEVSATTAQLMAASRVKAIEGSRIQPRLESAASEVTQATKQLVKAAKDASLPSKERTLVDNFSQLSMHDLKKEEMEQKLKILTLERDLVSARHALAQIRKSSYTS